MGAGGARIAAGPGVLREARRVWAVTSPYGRLAALVRVQKVIARRMRHGDRLVCLGGYLGGTDHPPGGGRLIDALLTFRRWFLEQPGTGPGDIVFLRGGTEEMWSQLFRLRLLEEPAEILDWMLARGLGAFLSAYGSGAAEARHRARGPATGFTGWTDRLAAVMNECPGHGEFYRSLRDAAMTAEGRLLFVHNGIDPRRSLEGQGDVFWWGCREFAAFDGPFEGFRRIAGGGRRLFCGNFVARINTCSPRHPGPVMAFCFGPDGSLLEWVES